MHRRMTTTAAPTTTERQLEDALRAALAGTGPAGVLVLGPSGAGKTALVRACLARLGCSRVEYSGALTLRNRAYFESFESQQRGGGGSGGCILDLLRAASHQQQQQQQLSAATTPLLLPPAALAEPLVLVVDDMDTLANDAGHGLDGLQRLLPLPPPSHHQSSSSSSSLSSHHRVVAVCIATGRHKSDKRLMDLYRRCTEVRVSAPAVWDASRGGAAAAPGRAAGERALYPLVHSLLSRALPAGAVAAAGLSEPDRAAVGLLVHENLHEYCGAAASDAALAAVARDHATADAVSTLPHQAQTWHQWELGFALRALRPNRRLFHNNDDNGDNGIKVDGARTRVPVFTKLLTRCSTESGTRAFLTDMCFRLGCSWRELFPMLTRLDAEFSALIARPTPPPLLACLRQAGAGARRGPAAAAEASSSSSSTEAAPLAPTQQQQRSRATVAGTAARFDWLHLRLSSMLVSSAQARYLPRLALSDVRRMYRCLRAESAQGARVNRRSEAAAAAAAANAAAARKGGQERRRPKKDGEDDDDDDVNDDDAVDEDFGDEGGGGGENEDEEEEEDGADCDDDGADDDSDGGVVRKRRRRRES